MSTQPEPMETLREALARLERRGFEQAFRALADGCLQLERGEALDPEALVVDEVVRFEGISDPQDQAVLFALRSQDGRVRGTFVATYGASMEPSTVAAIERLTPHLSQPAPREDAQGGSRPSGPGGSAS